MDPTLPYDDILEDETLAPLKRNHACLQCKKRKVKCDAIKPTCSPCLRSHAHAVRSAHRNGTTPPILICTYTEGDLPEGSPTEETAPKKKKSVSVTETSPGAGVKRQATGQGQRDFADKEKESLKAKIAELEARLAAMTTTTTSGAESSRAAQGLYGPTPPSTTSPVLKAARSTNIGMPAWNAPIIGLDTGNNVPLPEGLGGSFPGLDNLFLVPVGWPKHLPLPFLLEHLIETFFNFVPQTPRMIHRASLLRRIKLPPTSSDFPFTGLLHAICAAAANYTAWVNNLAPDLLEDAVQKHLSMGIDLVHIEDFGLAQAHAGHQSVDVFTSACIMGGGEQMLEMTQACLLIGDVYFAKGFPMKGWMMAAQPSRILAVLELGNRHPRPTHKPPMLKKAETDLDREARLITLWMAFVIDAGFAINSNWAPSMQLKDARCGLPTSGLDWIKLDGRMRENPQFAESDDLFYSHPVEDSFVFVVKGSILMSLSAQWLRDWQQRERTPGDEMSGPQTSSFRDLMLRIEAFTTSMPSALKNVLRLLDSSNSGGFDSNLLSVHIIPNIAICLLQEPFMTWEPYDHATLAMQRAYEAVLGILHLIPSNLDITLILTPFLAFSLYTVGRFVVDFIHHSMKAGNYQAAARYHTDLLLLENLLERYGQRHPLGNAMVHFLKNYLQTNKEDLETAEMSCPTQRKRQITFGNDSPINQTTLGALAESNYYAKIDAHQNVDLGHSQSRKTSTTGPSPNTASYSGSNTTPSINTPNTSIKSSEPTPESSGVSPMGLGDQSWTTWNDWHQPSAVSLLNPAITTEQGPPLFGVVDPCQISPCATAGSGTGDCQAGAYDLSLPSESGSVPSMPTNMGSVLTPFDALSAGILSDTNVFAGLSGVGPLGEGFGGLDWRANLTKKDEENRSNVNG